MALGMSTVVIVGHIGQNPELRTTTSTGRAVTNLRVAVNQPGGHTDWFTVIAWNALAEACAKHLGKGSLVAVTGRLTTRTYEKNGQNHTVVEIIAARISFLSRPGNSSELTSDEAEGGAFSADDLPF